MLTVNCSSHLLKATLRWTCDTGKCLSKFTDHSQSFLYFSWNRFVRSFFFRFRFVPEI